MPNTSILENNHLTWSDYSAMEDGLRWELIDGKLFDMSPSPTSRHQSVSMELSRQFATALSGKPCKAFAAPMDVKLSDETVVQPDILVVCNRWQIKTTHIEGPPSLVVEILSESSFRRDRLIKMNLYARHGIPEFWLVSPFPPTVEQFVLDNANYRLVRTASRTDHIAAHTLPDIEIDLGLVFDLDYDQEDNLQFCAEETEAEYSQASI